MATDFNKLIFKTVEEYMKRQIGKEAAKKMTSKEWRKFMDEIMKHFAGALTALVAEFSERQVEAKKVEDAERQMLEEAQRKIKEGKASVIKPSDISSEVTSK